ncbi:MAG TPA: hypothetical protein VGN17_24855 [Bryobacteraceae bacterium]|jgi:hypothetical protein
MRYAVDAIAQVLFDAGILSVDLLGSIALLVWDSANFGGWFYIPEETRQEFAQQRGHDDVWSDQDALFRAQIAHWQARLLDAAPQSGRLEVGPVDAQDCRGLRGSGPEANLRALLPKAEGKVPKRRGAKGKFTPEQLDEARKIKAAGKTNNQAAKLLYGSSPTYAQRRSVSTILKHHFGSKAVASKKK